MGGWTVSAVNASGDPVFSAEDDTRKGEITVSVPYNQELTRWSGVSWFTMWVKWPVGVYDHHL